MPVTKTTSSISDGVSGRASLQSRTIGWDAQHDQQHDQHDQDDQQASMLRRVPRREPLVIEFHYNLWNIGSTDHQDCTHSCVYY